MNNYFFTSESVTEGHPDKICDKISDTILDEALKQDKESKMAIEATIKDELILIYGEANTKANLDFEGIAKKVIKRIGYKEDYEVIIKINKQSEEINKAVVKTNGEVGAGDQGIMFGFACNDTKNYMPAAIDIANKLARQLNNVSRKNNILLPDGKTQVTVEYENGKVKRIDTIVISTQHMKNISNDTINELVMNSVIKPIVNKNLIDENTKFLINPSGSFILGGSFGDSGTTGRKIVCDTYGGYGRVGGGCLSSKDPSKVDRSAAYYCRYVAKNIVANKLADKCEIGVAYVIGKPYPISIYLNTFHTNMIPEEEILEKIHKNFDFSVKNIINELDLKKPIYEETSCYGHFGRDEFSWEKIKVLV